MLHQPINPPVFPSVVSYEIKLFFPPFAQLFSILAVKPEVVNQGTAYQSELFLFKPILSDF